MPLPTPRHMRAMNDVASKETEALMLLLTDRAKVITDGDLEATLVLTSVEGVAAVINTATQAGLAMLAFGGAMKPADLQGPTLDLFRQRLHTTVDRALEIQIKS